MGTDAQPMVGQVGGISLHKKPLLTLKPDYVLKPLLTDHRGIREIAFYEAMRAVAKQASIHSYNAFLTGSKNEQGSSSVRNLGEFFDTFALAMAMLLSDPVVTESELAVKDAYKAVKREVEGLHRLAKFTPPYYGVVHLSHVQTLSTTTAPTSLPPCGVFEEDHLLLQDLTVNFSKPCVMDLKVGSQTFEPDAPPEKKAREIGKYPQQEEFCFRIVGMRMYDPSHADADSKGFRYFGKEYGRSLTTRDKLLEAFRIFFSAGMEPESPTAAPLTNGSTTLPSNGTASVSERIRTRSVSNVVMQLRAIRRWFEENTTFRFYASSLLIVYEGDVAHDGKDVTDIKMIDFGRVRREAGGDEGYRSGLSSLKHVLTDLLDEEQEQRERRNSEGGIGASTHSRSPPRPQGAALRTAS